MKSNDTTTKRGAHRRHHAEIRTTGKINPRQTFTVRMPRSEYLSALNGLREAIGYQLGFPISNSIVVRLALHELAHEVATASADRLHGLARTARRMASKRAQKNAGYNAT